MRMRFLAATALALGLLAPATATASTTAPVAPNIHPMHATACDPNSVWLTITKKSLTWDVTQALYWHNGGDKDQNYTLHKGFNHTLTSTHTVSTSLSAKAKVGIPWVGSTELSTEFGYTFAHANQKSTTVDITVTIPTSVGKTYVAYNGFRHGELWAKTIKCSSNGVNMKLLGTSYVSSWAAKTEKIGALVCTGKPYPARGSIGAFIRTQPYCQA